MNNDEFTEILKKFQRDVLFGIMGFWTPEDGWCPNPFYKRTEKDIVDNCDYAKKIYPKVFKSFMCRWYERSGMFKDFPYQYKQVGELIV